MRLFVCPHTGLGSAGYCRMGNYDDLKQALWSAVAQPWVKARAEDAGLLIAALHSRLEVQTNYLYRVWPMLGVTSGSAGANFRVQSPLCNSSRVLLRCLHDGGSA